MHTKNALGMLAHEGWERQDQTLCSEGGGGGQ